MMTPGEGYILANNHQILKRDTLNDVWIDSINLHQNLE